MRSSKARLTRASVQNPIISLLRPYRHNSKFAIASTAVAKISHPSLTIDVMNGRPRPNEAAPYYFTYIDQVPGDNALAVIESQLDECLQLLSTISEDKSLHRYAVEKWSIRQVLNHLSDTERAFAFRALWFARGFDTPLPIDTRII